MASNRDRREFLKCGAALAVAAAVTEETSAGTQPAGGGEDPKHPRIVDTHQHLWDLSRQHLPWLQKDSPLHRSFVMQDYLQATEAPFGAPP